VDASGLLPDGRSFQKPAELKAILTSSREAFVLGLTEKLLIYALGRGLERYDRPTVAGVAAKLSSHDYKFSQLIMGIVDSLPFQMRRASIFSLKDEPGGGIEATAARASSLA
jgi:hypothetical protein